eukprot:TRINITY_DN6219_c0_g1_i1.p1 TRINITY_DN6219_c0_g1~~TRINITY_DN6219_c0_g1_i1.p1  ORF type:complete len:243 (+),score=70.48 TRINITY_DN6219_c0_g1_i1:182-910(+)
MYDIGLRDGYKVVLLPMKAGINARPHWSVRQKEAVTFKMEDRHKKLRVTDKTQAELKEMLGKDLFAAYEISGLTMHDPKDSVDAVEAKNKALAAAKAKNTKPRANVYKHLWGDREAPKYKRREVQPLCDWTTEAAKIKHESRPLRNFDQSLKESMSKSLMGKNDTTLPAVSSFKEWFSTYGQSDNFFKSGTAGLDDTGGRETMYGYVDKKATGIMSRFERSRRMYGKDRSNAVSLRKGGLCA